MRKVLKTKIQAFSLLEVIVMLVVVSMTMIAAMSLVAKTTVSIKNNENLDVINGLLFKTIELLKTPAPVYLSSDGYAQVVGTTNTQYFALNEKGSTKSLTYAGGSASAITVNYTCNSTSPYFYTVTVNGVTQSYNVCIQVAITRTLIPSSSNYYYAINSIVVYNTNGQNHIDNLKTYRYDAFASF